MLKRLVVLALLVFSVSVVGCNKGKAPTPPPEKKETKAPPDKTVLLEVKKIYVCKENSMYLDESEERGALCPDGAKVLKWVERLNNNGWSKDDILDLVRSLQMGEPIVKKTGASACVAPGKLKLDLFIMSYCPFGVKFVTDILVPMLSDMGSSVAVTPYFILQPDQTGKLSSMHGQKEVDEDMRMICIRDKFGVDKWLAYTRCFASEIYNNRQNPKDWKFCATQAGLDAGSIDTCAKTEARNLANKDMQLSNQYQAFGSPTAVYNCENLIVGARPYPEIKGSLCRMFQGQKPPACGN